MASARIAARYRAGIEASQDNSAGWRDGAPEMDG
jgi:hypothetical protein